MTALPLRTHALVSRLALTILLAGTSIVGPGCNVDELLGTDYYESRVSRKPERRVAKTSDTRCYSSFDTYKAREGDAGEGMEWHHTVGQHAANERKFGRLDLNCTDNLVRIQKPIHTGISAHYPSKTARSEGKTVRAWQAEKSFNEQYEYGIEVLRRHGIQP